MDDPSAVVKEIKARLSAAGTPERAAGERRYLKSSLTHLGVSIWGVRRDARLVATQIESHDELVALVEALWSEPVHECRAHAAFLLEARLNLLGPTDLDLLLRMVRTSKTWALVDVLAGDVLGRLLVRHPEAAVEMDSWALDQDFWVRRSALLAQIEPLKAGAAFERFARYADAMLEEKEFFIRKAMGWVLRETGKRRPDEVFAWALPRVSRMSSVTFNETGKHLSASQKEALLAARPSRSQRRRSSFGSARS